MSRHLLKSTAITGGMTFLSRISGLIRDTVFARIIGAGGGIAADAFYVAFRIPNFLRRIFAEGAFSQAFVPVYSEVKAGGDEKRIRDFAAHVTGVLGAVLLAVTILGVLAAPVLVSVMAPGFHDAPGKFDLTVAMTRWMFPYILFISLTSLAAGILNTHGKFWAAAFTPVMLNLTLILAALFLSPHFERPVMALAVGVFFAGVAQLVFLLPFLARHGGVPRPRPALHDPDVRKVLKLMVPGIFGVSVSQINLLINTIIASFLVTGSVSWLYYSDRLMEFPIGVFGVALGTVILPSLSLKHANGSHEDYSRTLDWAIRWVLLIGVPSMFALFVLAGPLTATAFQYGAFDAHDTRMAALALQAFTLGMPGFLLVKVLAPGFYARQDTKTPVRIGMIALAVNMVLSLALVWPFRSLGYGHVALALSTSVAALLNAGLLYRGLRRLDIYRPQPDMVAFCLKVITASALMAGLLYMGSGALDTWTTAAWTRRLARTALWVTCGFGVYVGAALGLGLRPRHLRHG